MVFLIENRISIQVHLTVTAIELQAETAAVAESQEEGLAPRGASSAVLGTVAQGVAQTVAALHEHGVFRGVQFVGRRMVNAVKSGGNVVGDVGEVGILRGRSNE